MRSTIAFLFGVLCGISGLTHVLYWLLIAGLLVAGFFTPGFHCR